VKENHEIADILGLKWKKQLVRTNCSLTKLNVTNLVDLFNKAKH
jgi:hypothetical protein